MKKRYRVFGSGHYFLVVDGEDGSTVRVYPERISADTLCNLLNKEVAA
jgi:hypothetical protein